MTLHATPFKSGALKQTWQVKICFHTFSAASTLSCGMVSIISNSSSRRFSIFVNIWRVLFRTKEVILCNNFVYIYDTAEEGHLASEIDNYFSLKQSRLMLCYRLSHTLISVSCELYYKVKLTTYVCCCCVFACQDFKHYIYVIIW